MTKTDLDILMEAMEDTAFMKDNSVAQLHARTYQTLDAARREQEESHMKFRRIIADATDLLTTLEARMVREYIEFCKAKE